jgi:hypothetical protein
MSTIEKLEKFQYINSECDIMGVVRTLFPDGEIIFTLDDVKEKADEEVQD